MDNCNKCNYVHKLHLKKHIEMFISFILKIQKCCDNFKKHSSMLHHSMKMSVKKLTVHR